MDSNGNRTPRRLRGSITRSAKSRRSKRIRGTSGELELRVAELERADAALSSQFDALDSALAAIESVLRQPELLPLAANG